MCELFKSAPQLRRVSLGSVMSEHRKRRLKPSVQVDIEVSRLDRSVRKLGWPSRITSAVLTRWVRWGIRSRRARGMVGALLGGSLGFFLALGQGMIYDRSVLSVLWTTLLGAAFGGIAFFLARPH